MLDRLWRMNRSHALIKKSDLDDTLFFEKVRISNNSFEQARHNCHFAHHNTVIKAARLSYYTYASFLASQLAAGASRASAAAAHVHPRHPEHPLH